MDFNLDSNKKKTIMNGEQVRAKVQSLTKIFMNPSLQLIFASTKQSLLRNSKIAKIN